MPDSILKSARNAVWDAVDNWSAFDGVFNQTYRFDEDAEVDPENPQPLVNPTPDEIPALAIYPDPSNGKMVTNKQHEIPYKLIALMWTNTWYLDTSDYYSIEFYKSLWQSDGGTGTPYVKAVTKFWPMNEFSISQRRIWVDETKATLTRIGVTLRVRFDPQTA